MDEKVSADHAPALLNAFVRPERRARYLGLLASAKGRAKLRAQLAHFRDLDPRYATPVSGGQTAAAIAQLLAGKGAPAVCYVLSEDADLDGREMPLADALAAVVGRGMGTFLSCVPGWLAYFEGEEPGERFVLERRAPAI